MEGHILRVLIPHIYPSVGYCVVYLGPGLSTTFSRINEVSPTLSLYISLSSWGWGGCLKAMITDSMKNEQYSAPEIETFNVECEGVFCTSDLDPGAGEDGEDGDAMYLLGW